MKYFLSILFSLILIFLNFRILVFDYSFYEKSLQSNPDFNKDIVLNLLNYLKNNEQLNREIYSEREIFHLRDVKSIISKSIYLLYLFLFVFLLLLLKFYKEIPNIILASGLFTLLIVIILASLNFADLFYNFHLILFNNDLWLLEPGSTLIKLFPEYFFSNFLKNVLTRSGFISILLVLSSLIWFYRKSENKEKNLYI